MKLRSGSEGAGYVDYTRQYWGQPSGGSASYSEGTYHGSYSYRSFTGYDLANYHKRKKRGELLPFTPWTQFEGKGQVNSSTYDKVRTSDNYHWWITPEWSPWFVIAQDQTALTALISEYDADPYVQEAAAAIYNRGWDALTFIGELRETVTMLRNFGPKLGKFLERMSRAKGKLAKAKVLANVAPGQYLEYRYGWRTLMYDVEDISEALTGLGKKIDRYKERRGMTHSWVDTDVTSYTDGLDITRTITNSFELSVRGNVIADIDPPEFAFNPVTTAWELTRLSFVVDWFLSVGTALEAVSFMVLSRQHQAAKGWYITCNSDITTTSSSNASWSGTIAGNGSYETKLTVRQPSNVPFLPQIRTNLDFWKILDIYSIFVEPKAKLLTRR